MTYKIIIQNAAIGDANQYASYILEQSKNRKIAANWLNELEKAISSLTKMPKRYKIIEEQKEFGVELRQLLHHSHRIIYHIDNKSQIVHVLRIYHAAKKPISPSDLP